MRKTSSVLPVALSDNPGGLHMLYKDEELMQDRGKNLF